MSHALAQLLAERIAEGLGRRVITSCSKWALKYRMMGQPYPGPWSFKHHPWLAEPMDSEAPMNVAQKSAQMGLTECVLNRTFFMIDVRGVDCLYVLPNKNPDASDFSSGRFNPALELSPHLTKLFSDTDNVGHKRAGSANLYVRGSKSRSGLKSIPVGFVVLDEVAEFEEANIPLIFERQAGQVEKQAWCVSTPTIPEAGISKLFADTTQEHFFFKCPMCGKRIELLFPQCLEITANDVNDPDVENSFLKCSECKGKLIHETKYDWLKDGIWVPNYTQREARGFTVNQLYSSTVEPVALAKSYLKSLRDPSVEQEFYNSQLGLPHIVSGAGVTDADINACTGEFKKLKEYYGNSVITMGVDVGKWLHVEIDQWQLGPNTSSFDLNVQSQCRIIEQRKVLHFEELDLLMQQYNISACVIDVNPERRKAYEFATRFYGFVKMCQYGQGVTGKQIHITKEDEPIITVDRTSWLDLSLGRFKTGKILTPLDLDLEYKSNVKALVRVYEKDRHGNQVGRYIRGSQEDHYAHARNYAEIALPFAVSAGEPQDMENIL